MERADHSVAQVPQGREASPAVSLEQKVAFLQEPRSHVSRTSRVESIETHMAWVFLTDDRAYKLKKPVRDAFRDLVTIEARRRCCELEVRLNRRLAPDVYLGVVPLVAQSTGALCLGGEGQVVDWLVEMRRLPGARMLDALLRQNAASDAEVAAVGRKLARFYRGARRIPMTGPRYLRRLARDIRATRRTLLRPRYGLDRQPIIEVADRLMSVLRTHACSFGERARRVVDGHGDLRPEHICLEPEPVIIDCIEFRADLRMVDALADLAFLALECERLGAAAVGRLIIDTYAREARDPRPEVVVGFYMAQNALARAKVAIWHLDDARVKEPARWLAKARTYLELAGRHASAACLEP